MAFSKENLVLVSDHGNSGIGQTWNYYEDETVANIAASAYMNDAADIVKKGDIIFIHGSNGTGISQVTSNTGATPVTVGALTALS